jgi:hypothetical protein
MVDVIGLLWGRYVSGIVGFDELDFGIRRNCNIRWCRYFHSWWLGARGSNAVAGVFFICPFDVAVESGKYFRTALAVRPGQVEN